MSALRKLDSGTLAVRILEPGQFGSRWAGSRQLGGSALQRSGGPAVRRSGAPDSDSLAVRCFGCWLSGAAAVRRSGGPAVRRCGGPAVRRSGGPHSDIRPTTSEPKAGTRRSGGPAVRRSGAPVLRRSGGPAVRIPTFGSPALRISEAGWSGVSDFGSAAVGQPDGLAVCWLGSWLFGALDLGCWITEPWHFGASDRKRSGCLRVRPPGSLPDRLCE